MEFDIQVSHGLHGLTRIFLLLLLAPPIACAQQVFTEQGVSIEFTAVPRPIAGEETTVQFKITGTSGGVPLSNLRPVAWLDQREPSQPSTPGQCKEKVQSFLQASFTRRPTLDLNAYYILALNNEANISVIDPLSGFGGSKLFTLIPLKSPGEDWLLTDDNKKLFVSMPASNQVALIDVPTWKVVASIDAGVKPARLALQHDQKYLWVGTEDGVTVIDTVSAKPAAHIKTAAGAHEIVFNDDDSIAFVSNREASTLSVIDIPKLAALKQIKLTARPVTLAYSSLSKTAYVAGETGGSIVAIGGSRQDVIGRIEVAGGVHTIALPSEGHFGFALNATKDSVNIFDVSSNRVVHTVPVEPDSDQISFTRQFAYVRSAKSEFVTMINLGSLGKEAAVTRFPAGQRAPGASVSIAPAIVAAPEEGSVLVANPADQMIYYYTEGMAAPMGSFQNYKRDPRALLVLDNSLRETDRGVYSSSVRLPGSGVYDVVFLLDAPRVINCFEMSVADNPAYPKKVETSIKIEALTRPTSVNANEKFTFRFKVLDAKTRTPKTNLKDVSVLVFLAPGIWQHNDFAKPAADGSYEMTFVPPEPGVYYIFFQIPALELLFNQTTPLTLQVVKP